MESEEVYGANDPHVSSRDKDKLFADEPRETMDDGQRALDEHRKHMEQKGEEGDTADLTDSLERARGKEAEPAEGMLAQPVPERHVHTAYEEEARDATVADADFEAAEQNKKGGDA